MKNPSSVDTSISPNIIITNGTTLARARLIGSIINMISNYYSGYLGLTDALCHDSLPSLYNMWFSTDYLRNWLKTNIATGQVYIRTINPSKWGD